MSTNAPPPPATPGGEVADEDEDRACGLTERTCREERDRLSRALTASEEARKAAERERDMWRQRSRQLETLCADRL